MEILINIIAFIVVFTVVVTIHEYGHFIMAKKFGVKVFEFSIGMGPLLIKKSYKKTDYSIRGLPIGGYVALAGDDDQIVEINSIVGINMDSNNFATEIITYRGIEARVIIKVTKSDLSGKDGDPYIEGIDIHEITHHYKLNAKTKFIKNTKTSYDFAHYKETLGAKRVWQRIIILLTGPLMNFFLALILNLIVALAIGAPINSNRVNVAENNILYNAGMRNNDTITSIDGVAVNSWEDISQSVFTNAGNSELSIVFTRNGVVQPVISTYPRIDINSVGLTNLSADGSIQSQPIIGQTFGFAFNSGLRGGDVINSVGTMNNGAILRTTPSNWGDLVSFFNGIDGDRVIINRSFTDESGLTHTGDITIDTYQNKIFEKQNATKISFSLGITQIREFNFGFLFSYSIATFGKDAGAIFSTLEMLFNPNDQIGLGDLTGPVGIFQIIGRTARQGIIPLLAFTSFFSVNLGIINLLPIPLFDGGRILIESIEGVSRKKLNKKVINRIFLVTGLLLIALTFFILFKDISRLF